MNLSRIFSIVKKELLQLKRDKTTFAMVVMIPLIQLLLFGFAINTDIRNIPVGVVDQSGSTAGRIIAQSVEVTQVVDITGALDGLFDCQRGESLVFCQFIIDMQCRQKGELQSFGGRRLSPKGSGIIVSILFLLLLGVSIGHDGVSWADRR